MSGYSNFVTALSELMGGYTITDSSSATPSTDADFNAILPSIIADAEGMMYRDPDLDFLATRDTDSSQTTVAGARTLPIPPNFLTIEQAVLITPAGAPVEAGTRVSMSRVTPEFINATYPVANFTAAPQYGASYYAMFNAANIMIAPTPDDGYVCEYYGVVTQTPLSSTFPDTLLTTNFGDVFLAASMIYASAYMKNFSAMSDSPPQAMSWQNHYSALKSGASFYSARQRYLSSMATAYPPAPQVASPR